MSTPFRATFILLVMGGLFAEQIESCSYCSRCCRTQSTTPRPSTAAVVQVKKGRQHSARQISSPELQNKLSEARRVIEEEKANMEPSQQQSNVSYSPSTTLRMVEVPNKATATILNVIRS